VSAKAVAPTAAAERVFRASHRRASTSVKKARPVIDLIRGKRVAQARDILRYTPKRAAYYIDRVLLSAIANAESTVQVDVDDLVVSRCWIDEGPARPGRWKYAAHGRVRPIRKRTSHINVELAVIEAEEEEKKPRKSASRSGAKKAKE
jgi:large subunit ribosomal protein L22